MDWVVNRSEPVSDRVFGGWIYQLIRFPPITSNPRPFWIVLPISWPHSIIIISTYPSLSHPQNSIIPNMGPLWRFFYLLILLPLQSIPLTIDDDEFELNLQLIKHQPCPFKPERSKWERKLEFEPGTEQDDGPKLVPRPNEPNCYSIGGKVTVFSEFKGDFSIYLELRSSANKKHVPEACNNRQEDGCGGYGSCLYCDACKALAENKGLKARLLLNGKPISCGQSLAPGTYDNLELGFCMPDTDELLRAQGLSRDSFKLLIQSEGNGASGGNLRSLGVFATIYIFDRDVRKLVQTQQKVEAVYRKTKRTLFKDEPLPPDVYWSLPFNSVIKEQRLFVACHKIYGNLQIRETKNDNNKQNNEKESG